MVSYWGSLCKFLFCCDCAGGLGEAVCGALSEECNVCVRRLAVTGIPRSGPGNVLMDIYGISARHIVAAVKGLISHCS